MNVNARLPTPRYRLGMPLPKKPGSPKGQLKPAKRTLDPDFPGRLRAAISTTGWSVPEVAEKAKCTRAVIGKYLNGGSKTIEAMLLFDLADVLDVSAEWLLRGIGEMARVRSLGPEESRVLNTFNGFVNLETRDFWISQGEDLIRRQPALIATKEDPFKGKGPPKTATLPLHLTTEGRGKK